MRQDILHPVIRPRDVEVVCSAALCPSTAMEYMGKLRECILALTGAPDCVLTCNCTQALRISLLLLTNPGKVVVPDLTFVATAHSVLAAGRTPVLVDITPDLLHMSPPGSAGWPRSASACVPVELLGRPIRNELVMDLWDYGAPIIVDAAQSFGSTKWNDCYTAMCISFAANKIVHGHQGGAILAQKADCDRIRKYVRHGRGVGVDGYHHESPGENLGMNPLGAALAYSQTMRIQEIMDRRQRQREKYLEAGVLRNFSPYGNGWVHVGMRADNRAGPCCDLWEPLHMAPHLASDTDYPVSTSAWRNLVALPSSDDLEV